MHFARPALCALYFALTAHPVHAQRPPASALNAGGANPPASSFHAPATPSVNQPSALQATNLPADLARMNDSAIIIIGGKPTSVAEVKRAVLSLDDKAIIIIGGRHIPAGGMKQELQAGARKPVEAPAAKGREKLESHVSSKPITTVSPRRAILLRQVVAIRDDQNRVADAVSRTQGEDHALRVGTPAGVSPWPQAPFGTKALETSAANKSFGIFAINGRTKGIRLTPGGRVAITGIGLGEPDSVRLVGGALEQHPVRLGILSRAPTRIDAEIPSTTRGLQDEKSAAIEVRTTKGATYRFDGVSFIAAREEITITDPNLMAVYAWSIVRDPHWDGTNEQTGIYREQVGKSIDCKAPGTDHVHFKGRNGFNVVGASMTTGRTDSGDDDDRGNAGSRVFTPGYSFGDWVDENIEDWFYGGFYVSALAVNWGVFRSHSSSRISVDAGVDMRFPPLPYGGIDSTDAHDRCTSGWMLSSLTLYGPAGVTP